MSLSAAIAAWAAPCVMLLLLLFFDHALFPAADRTAAESAVQAFYRGVAQSDEGEFFAVVTRGGLTTCAESTSTPDPSRFLAAPSL